jgi:immune inhibitor A
MSPENKSASWWFMIGLVVTLLVCLLLGVFGVGAYRLWMTWSRRLRDAAKVQSTSIPLEPSATAQGFDARTILPTVDADGHLAQATLEQLSTIIVPINDPIDLAERFKGLEGIPEVVVQEAEPIPLGSVERFWVSDNDENLNFQVDAELVYATDHVYFWVEQGVNYDFDEAVALIDTFENDIYPTNRTFFGSEWRPGVDGDPHLYVLYAHGLGNSVAGYFGSNDEFSPRVHEYSNAHEMFYISADHLSLSQAFTYGVLAHEFQHMIHWYRDANESTWMNEGFSELAALLNGYYEGGFDFLYATDPDLALSFWPGSGNSGPHYGQAFLFVTYFLDRFGPEVTQELIAHDANGLKSIDQVLLAMGVVDPKTGEIITANEIYRDWAAALWLQDPTVDDGRYGYRSYHPPSPRTSMRIEDCPTEARSGEVNQYGLDYIVLRCEGDYVLEFQGVRAVPVVPADPHSGKFAFWSNRGDTSNMILTRAFDFTTAVNPIALDYWTWYDIEEGWDYVYVEVSDDGGGTWEIMETPSGTGENPSGNSYGWGYTGPSGGGDGRWIQERVDLSAYAGGQVLIRFEYVTDAAVNGEGFLLDDVSIEAIEYAEDFEEGDGGWEAHGFARIYNYLPQTYRVVIIEDGVETRVLDLPLDDDQHGEIEFSIGDKVDQAVVIVIGTSRYTWQEAPYAIQILSTP